MSSPESVSPIGQGPGRFLGVDLGSVRIGIALSDSRAVLASPHSVITRSAHDEESAQAVARLATEVEAVAIVIGIPKSLSEHNVIAATKVEEFIALLRSTSELPVIEVDERFTTVLATKRLREAGHTSRTMKSHIDAMAAVEILQSYLDHRDKG